MIYVERRLKMANGPGSFTFIGNTLNSDAPVEARPFTVALADHSTSTGQKAVPLEGDGHGKYRNDQPKQIEETPTIDIVINNVVCSFNTRCHLNLKRIAMEGVNVIYKRENGMVSMKIRNPRTTASIWSSGKITCTGATSEEDSRTAGRRVARRLQLLGFKVKFCNFRVVNVLATCSFPFGIRITHFSRDNPEYASYEPELHPGVTYRLKPPLPKATLKIFSTGSVTVTAPRVANVSVAIEHIYSLVINYKMEAYGTPVAGKQSSKSNQFLNPTQRKRLKRENNDREENLNSYSGESTASSDFEDDESN